MVYNEEINHEWGTEVYPLVLKPTMKDLTTSKGKVWINTEKERVEEWQGKPWVVEKSDIADRLAQKTGIKSKGTHFKMNIGQKKVGLSELLVIRAREDSLNDFTKKVELMAISLKSGRSRK
jgi:hypothetical protein